MDRKRIIVGVSGASGIPLAICCLKELKWFKEYEIHLVVTEGAKKTLSFETDMNIEELKSLADVYHDNKDIEASIASGTFKVEGMIILPCSMKTLSGISHGYSDNLLLRAADVNIKEGRKLVLCIRETPLSHIHLDNLCYISKLHNITIMPPMLTYYNNPNTIQEMEIHIIGKILYKFGIEVNKFKRWGETN
ncbi:UbiX family flavin prenyltransferase [Clostridiaceae bacterium M8S5]|nr:UbiX family flavin prenyltransferase [Clostridiaceae bacterium M8S5]